MNNMPKKYYCYSKKFAQTWLAILLILSCISTSQAKEKINIGLLLDGHSQFESQIVEVLQVEMNKVLGAKYDVSLPQNKLLASAWSVEQAAKNFNALEKDPQVNVIISLGVLTSNVIFKQQQYAKPVIALSIVPPAQDAQGTSAKSTKNNLNTVLFNHSIVRDLADRKSVV